MCAVKVVGGSLPSLNGKRTEVVARIAELEAENKKLKWENQRLLKVIYMWERTYKLMK